MDLFQRYWTQIPWIHYPHCLKHLEVWPCDLRCCCVILLLTSIGWDITRCESEPIPSYKWLSNWSYLLILHWKLFIFHPTPLCVCVGPCCWSHHLMNLLDPSIFSMPVHIFKSVSLWCNLKLLPATFARTPLSSKDLSPQALHSTRTTSIHCRLPSTPLSPQSILESCDGIPPIP